MYSFSILLKAGSPSKESRKPGKGTRKGIKGKPFRELSSFKGFQQLGGKKRLLRLERRGGPLAQALFGHSAKVAQIEIISKE